MQETKTTISAHVIICEIIFRDIPLSSLSVRVDLEVFINSGSRNAIVRNRLVATCEEKCQYKTIEEKSKAIEYCKSSIEKQFAVFGLQPPKDHPIIIVQSHDLTIIKVSSTWDDFRG